MVAITTDFSTIQPNIGGSLPVKPEGWYRGMVLDTKSVGTKDAAQTGNTMLVMTIGFEDGSQYIERLNYWHSSEDARRIAREQLAAMLAAMGFSGPQLQVQDTTQFHNYPFDLFLGIEVSKGDKGDIRQNRIRAVRDPAGKIYGNVPATPPAGAAAAPQAGFAAPPAPPAQPAPGAAAFGGAPAQPWGGGGAQQAQPAPAAPPAPAPNGGGFPAPGAPAGGGFPAPGAPAGGFPAPGGAGGPWGGPAQR